MKYFLLLASEAAEYGPWEGRTPESQEEEMAKHFAFGEACEAAEGVEFVSGEALGDGSMATTMRVVDGEHTITDGPFAEAAEQIGGFYVLEAPSLDVVVELAKILPGYDIDIRPVMDVG